MRLASSDPCLLVVLGLCCPAVAFSSEDLASARSPLRMHLQQGHFAPPPNLPRTNAHSRGLPHSLFSCRGGQQQGEGSESTATADAALNSDAMREDKIPSKDVGERKMAAFTVPLASAARSLGEFYGTQLSARPVLTKSLTACIIFGLSDWSAQLIERSPPSSDDDTELDKSEIGKAGLDWTRIVMASLVGLLYFGPAAHAWYETIFKVFPGTSLVSTLQKAALGQILFGPSFTCIFFATSLIQGGTFTLSNWIQKIKADLPGAWMAGLGFWPLVDFVSYSLVPSQWIPLFVNFCSFVWTIYLSVVANKKSAVAS